MHLEPDYTESFLLPPAIEDWIPSDHPARFIREFVDELDLSALGLKCRAGHDGRPSYSPSMLLKLWLYGYFLRQRSSRKLEAACRESMGAIWLAGRMTPDHNTLWRFWNNNRDAIENLFKHSVKVALRLRLVAMVFHALDGTKILAACSRRSAVHLKDLEKLLPRLDQAVSEISAQIEQAEHSERTMLRLEIKDLTRRKQAMREALEQLQAEERKAMHPSEPEARMMMTGSGRNEWAYNAQAVVDDKCGIIVTADVSTQATDDHNLVTMLDQTKEAVGVAERVLADAAYGHSEYEVAQAEQAGYPVVTARPKAEQSPYHISRFTFDRATKTLVCPQGQTMRCDGSEARGERKERMLRFKCPYYRTCPVAHLCCNRDKEGKLRQPRMGIGAHFEAMQRQRQVVDEETRQLLMHRRLGTVEPIFGRMKWLEDFRRFSFRGLEKVRTQWRMMALLANLRTVEKLWRRGLVDLKGLMTTKA